MIYVIRDYEAGKELDVRVNANHNFLEINIEGFGEHDSEEGYGCPILLDYFNGKLQLFVYADINNPEPTHQIDLMGALESNRNPVENS